ncbi:MAG: alpha/beta hydrolase [Euryarchaeota archaeon]|nr:alpha/beta hydrolase [Euryarchaeota archaeon]
MAITFFPTQGSAHEGAFPVVLLHGWTGDGDSFREMVPKLEAQGLAVLDFDPATAGTQALSYGPMAAGQHVSYIAGKVVEEAILDALAAAGYPADQKVDVIAHSMGGLVARFLIEQPGADVDHWSASSGWYGDGTPDVRSDWAARVDDLIMTGTPNHGTWEAWVPSTIGGFGDWNAAGSDMVPGSTFLERMGYAAPSGEHYHAIGGDPAYLNFLKWDYDGDGFSRGFDGVVPAESPYVTGATIDYVDGHHGALLSDDDALDLIIEFLGQTSVVDGIGGASLAGDAVVRLEYLDVVQDHDGGSSDEMVVDVYVDADGSLGPAGYTNAGRHTFSKDGPFTVDWGDTGPTFASVKVPGTSPLLDVKVVVLEDDTSWGGGYEAVSTHYVTNILLSEDIDGMDFYAKGATDSKGGTNTVRVSVNGVTSDVGETRAVELGLERSYVKDDHDWGKGEVTYYLNAGRVGYTSQYSRGEIGGTHYSRDSGSWVDIGSHSKNDGTVEAELVWSGRMLEDATLRFDVTYWEDDGGWSGADGGNMYYLEKSLAQLSDGTSRYKGTSLSDYDVYISVVKYGPGESPALQMVEEMDAVENPVGLLPDGPDDPPFGPMDPPL